MLEFMYVGILFVCYLEICLMFDVMECELCFECVGFVGIFVWLVDVVVVFIVCGWVECGCGDVMGWV